MNIAVEPGAAAREAALMDALYDAALDPRAWDRALALLADHLGARQVAVMAHHPASPDFNFVYAHGPMSAEDYRAYLRLQAPTHPAATAAWHAPTGLACHTGSYLPEDEYEASRYFREWAKPNGFAREVFLMTSKSEVRCSGVAAMLAADAPFTPAEAAARLQALGPHIARVMRIHDSLNEKARAASVGQAALRKLGVDVAILDGKGVVIETTSADSLLAAGEAAAEALAARLGDGAAAPLRAQGAAARWTEHKVAASSPGGPAYTVTWIDISREPSGGLVGGGNAASMLLIQRQGAQARLRPEVFIERYGLTQAETQVMLMLAGGAKAEDIARMLGNSIHTVRTHIARAMAKTGVNRQVDLVRLALGGLTPAPEA